MNKSFARIFQKADRQIYFLFGIYLLFLLFGYIFFDKGFAYIGIGELYVSEIGIGLGVATAAILWIRRELFWQRLKQPAVILLFVYMAWGLTRTIPYLRVDGINALRDAVLWGYAIYGLLICLIFPKNCIGFFVKVYNRTLPFILLWLPIGFVLRWYAGANFSLFGSPVAFLTLKPGDMGVHLGAIAAFLLLRLDKMDRPYSNRARTFFWILWWVAWLMYGITSRASMFSALLGMGAVLLVRPEGGLDSSIDRRS